ncbi:MAG: 7-cyano-7-deazaguanine synthase QueC [Chlamydiia bacterium]|nr:7-cyano-7-deazaguanine synthase QueC [Chlamydiia bacterium]
MSRAIVLLSGGLDSAVMLGLALEEGHEVLALSFDYGQRHSIELQAARGLCAHYGVQHRIIPIPAGVLRGSALTGDAEVPRFDSIDEAQDPAVPPTYVPARNTLFLAYAVMQAELFDADAIYFGPNADDACYPDCRPGFIAAYQELMRHATRQAVEGKAPTLRAPLLEWNKKRIVAEARRLHVPIDLTWSCYAPQMQGDEAVPCGACLACTLRGAALS